MFIKDRYIKYPLDQQFFIVKDGHTFAFDIYIRQTFIHDMKTRSSKMNLKEVIYLYKQDPSHQPVPSKSAQQYSQAYLRQVAEFLAIRIESSTSIMQSKQRPISPQLRPTKPDPSTKKPRPVSAQGLGPEGEGIKVKDVEVESGRPKRKFRKRPKHGRNKVEPLPLKDEITEGLLK